MFTLTILAAGMLAGLAAAAEPGSTSEEPSLAFTIPISDQVVRGELIIDGKTAQFDIREGSLLLLDASEEDREDRFGLTFRLLRDEDGAATSASVVVFAVKPNPIGGEDAVFLRELELAMGGASPLDELGRSVQLRLTDAFPGHFGDAEFVTDLWNAQMEHGPQVFSGFYDVLYSLYGPISGACRICHGVLICATHVQCDGETEGLGSP